MLDLFLSFFQTSFLFFLFPSRIYIAIESFGKISIQFRKKKEIFNVVFIYTYTIIYDINFQTFLNLVSISRIFDSHMQFAYSEIQLRNCFDQFIFVRFPFYPSFNNINYNNRAHAQFYHAICITDEFRTLFNRLVKLKLILGYDNRRPPFRGAHAKMAAAVKPRGGPFESHFTRYRHFRHFTALLFLSSEKSLLSFHLGTLE